MKNNTRNSTLILTVFTILFLLFSPFQQSAVIPVTGFSSGLASVQLAAPLSLQSIDTFAASLNNGDSGQLVGVFADGTFALPVVQQGGNSGYVSTRNNTLTQFGLASDYGSTGILAHNYLSGKYFSSLSSGQTISLVYGDGSVKNYTVSEVRRYQALSPNSQYSDFVNLGDTTKQLSSSDLFLETFGQSGALVLQTCISKNGSSSWGRLFVIAYAS